MASSSCVVTESSRPVGLERVISELTRGQEIADRLRLMLRETGFDGSPDSVFVAQSLVTQLLDTFTQSLSMIPDATESDDQVSQALPLVKSEEDSGDSYKKPAAKDRRGSYKRRRNSDTLVKDTPNLFEDGHAWRKYGQKVILNAKHPRNYFRCTHKYDQGCQASKQVQKIEDDPPLFRTTYHGQHTCKNLLKSANHIIMEADADATAPGSSIIWSFDSIKQEEDVQLRSAPDYYISPAAFSSGSDHGDVLSSDVYSCTASNHSSIDHMDAMVGSIEDFFEFGNLS